MNADPWDMAASRHLLRHIRAQLAQDSRRYGVGPSYLALRNSTSRHGDASAAFIVNVERLVAAKRAWAADMRDLAESLGTVSSEHQRSIWADHIGRAEAEIEMARRTGQGVAA